MKVIIDIGSGDFSLINDDSESVIFESPGNDNNNGVTEEDIWDYTPQGVPLYFCKGRQKCNQSVTCYKVGGPCFLTTRADEAYKKKEKG